MKEIYIGEVYRLRDTDFLVVVTGIEKHLTEKNFLKPLEGREIQTNVTICPLELYKQGMYFYSMAALPECLEFVAESAPTPS